MSLFSTREWWDTRLGSNEEFHLGSLCVANIDNDPSGAVKIVTGSLQGVLRVHQPHQAGCQIEDILLEAELGSSILQVAAGNFLQSPSLCLAVLHPRKLCVYSLQAVGSSYLQLHKAFEHKLERHSANFTYGPFGGAAGVDHVAVQSLDGQLAFYEHEVAAFAVELPDFLLPGPLVYLPTSDCFVTATSAFELVAFSFSAAAAASTGCGQGMAAGASTGTGKALQYAWRTVLGEMVLDIKLGSVTAEAPGPNILALAEHTFFVLDQLGHLLVQRRLQHYPFCCWAYPAGAAAAAAAGTRSHQDSDAAQPRDNLLIVTAAMGLHVYRGHPLAWAAKLDLLPVAVRVTTTGGLAGMIVALDDAGRLSVLYLGTEPPTQHITCTESRPMDYAAMEDERKALLLQLQQAGAAAGLDAAIAAKAAAKAAAARSAGPLLLKAKVPSRCDTAAAVGTGSITGAFGAGLAGGLARSGSSSTSCPQQQLTLTLVLTNTGKAALKELVVSVHAPHPLELQEGQQQQLLLPELPPASRNSQPTTLQIVLQTPSSYAAHISLPASNAAEIVVAYKGVDGQAAAAQLSVGLPMCMFCQVVPPLKSGEFRITLSTNRDAVQLAQVFTDMLQQASPVHTEALSRAQAANVMSFVYPGGQEVTVLVSKSGGRYRLQANSFPAMWLVLQQLVARLTDHFAAASKNAAARTPQEQQGDGGTAAAFAVTCDDALPLQDVFDLIEEHFAARQALASIDAALEQQEVAFRNIQKRLLVRYKDKNAAPLNQLDVLMEEVHSHIMELAAQMEAADAKRAAAAQALGAGVQLLLLLARFTLGLPDAEVALLSSCLTPVLHDGPELDWEEVTEAAMTHLLRTSLAHSAKDAATVAPPLAPAGDTARLKKHIGLVLERMAKGMRAGSGAVARVGGAGAAVAAQ